MSLFDGLIAFVVVTLALSTAFGLAWWLVTTGYGCPQCGAFSWYDFGGYRHCGRCRHYQAWSMAAGQFLDVPTPPEPQDDELPFPTCTEEDDPPGPLRFDPLADIPGDCPDGDTDAAESPAEDSD